MECPECGMVYVVRPDEGWVEAFDSRTSVFQCNECGLMLQLGLLAWQPSPSALRFGQDGPDAAEARNLRAMSGGWLWTGSRRPAAVPEERPSTENSSGGGVPPDEQS